MPFYFKIPEQVKLGEIMTDIDSVIKKMEQEKQHLGKSR